MSLGKWRVVGGGVNRKIGAPSRYKMMKGALPRFDITQQRTEKATNKLKNMNTPSFFDESGQGTGAGQNAAEENTEMRVLSIGVQPPKLNVLPMKETFLMRLKGMLRREKKETNAPRPVQTEWPMDRIVVVRNDLSDSDYELVWSEAPAAMKGTGPKPKGEQLVGRAWKKVNPFSKKAKEPKQPEPKQAETVEV